MSAANQPTGVSAGTERLAHIEWKIITLVALILVLGVAVLLRRDNVTAVGGFSRTDLAEIRGVVLHSVKPGWRSFTWANRRSWPRLTCEQLTFRILHIEEDRASLGNSPCPAAKVLCMTRWPQQRVLRAVWVMKVEGRWRHAITVDGPAPLLEVLPRGLTPRHRESFSVAPDLRSFFFERFLLRAR